MREIDLNRIVRDYLKLIQRSNINIDKLLTEIAQWYGIFTPISETTWGFAHNTMRDYLAACYWVESGTFSPSKVLHWDARSAYAACLVPDATSSVIAALNNSNDLYAFSECLFNNARIDTSEIAKALINHIDNHLTPFLCSSSSDKLTTEIKEDFFSLVSDELLYSLLLEGIHCRRRSGDIVTTFALAEMRKRNEKITPQIFNQLRIAYPYANFTFEVKRSKEIVRFQLADLDSHGVRQS